MTDADLPVIETRCRLKAEACRWVAEKRRRERSGPDVLADVDAGDRGLIARAKALPDCFLWMCHREPALPGDLSRYDELAGSFEAAGDAASMLRTVVANADEDETFVRRSTWPRRPSRSSAWPSA